MSATVDLFAAGRESRADHLWPGDRIHRGGRTLLVECVAVTHRADTEPRVRPVRGDATQTLRLPPGEIVPVVP